MVVNGTVIKNMLTSPFASCNVKFHFLSGVFVITHIQSCRNGAGYCILGFSCDVDKVNLKTGVDVIDVFLWKKWKNLSFEDFFLPLVNFRGILTNWVKSKKNLAFWTNLGILRKFLSTMQLKFVFFVFLPEFFYNIYSWLV